MQNNQPLNPQSPKSSQSEDVTNSPSVRSFGTVEDFEFSSDESLLKVPSLDKLPEAVVAMPRKRSNTLVQPNSPQDDTFPEQEFHHSRDISLSSRKGRYSTVTDFDSEIITSLLFHKHESGEFDFCHQSDVKFSDMMSSNEENEAHSDKEDVPVLEESDFGEEERESNSMHFLGATVTQDHNRSARKSKDINVLAVSSGLNAVTLGKQHHSPYNHPKMVKSTEEYEMDNEELVSSPENVEPISYVPLYIKNETLEGKFSEVSTPERNRGMSSETKSNWIPVRKRRSLRTNHKVYKSKKKNSDGMLIKKKVITMRRRAQSESLRTSQVGLKFPKIGSLTFRPNLQFCSPISPEDKRTDACIIM